MHLLIVLPKEGPGPNYSRIQPGDVCYSLLVSQEEKTQRLLNSAYKLLRAVAAKTQQNVAVEEKVRQKIIEFSWSSILEQSPARSIDNLNRLLEELSQEQKDRYKLPQEIANLVERNGSEGYSIEATNNEGITEEKYEFIESRSLRVPSKQEKAFQADIKKLGVVYEPESTALVKDYKTVKIYYLKKDRDGVDAIIKKNFVLEKSEVANNHEKQNNAENKKKALALLDRAIDLYIDASFLAGYVESLHRYGAMDCYFVKVIGAGRKDQRKELKQIKKMLKNDGIVEDSSGETYPFTHIEIDDLLLS